MARVGMLLRWPALATLAAGTGAVAVASSAAELFVPSIPDLADDVEVPVMHAGYLMADPQIQAALYFWSVDAKYTVTRPKTVIWLNGGPGCSSMDGLFLESGPFRFSTTDGLVHNNPHPWSDFANMVFIDQPYGTGYSPLPDGGASEDLDAVGEALLGFVLEYLRVFPEHQRDDIYVAGESYAGEYVPYFHKAWQRYLAAAAPNAIRPKIEGLMLSSPWMDYAHHYLSYVPFIKKHGLIDESHYSTLESLHQGCINALEGNEVHSPDTSECNKILNYALSHGPDEGRCFNIYDYRLSDTHPACGMNWPDGITQMTDYLSRDDVRAAVHAEYDGGARWNECRSQHIRYDDSRSPSSSALLPKILETTPVMILAGELDVICNADGLESMIANIAWGGSDEVTGAGFHESEAQAPLELAGVQIGTIQTGRNLTMVRVANGTHMLPVDKQRETQMLMHAFTGITGSFPDDVVMPSPGSDGPTAGGSAPEKAPPAGAEPEQPEQSTIDEAVRKAYYQAGFTALAVVLIFFAGIALWLRLRGEGSMSWSELGTAILHISRPKRAVEYVKLNTFRRSGRPEVILEESEPEEDV